MRKYNSTFKTAFISEAGSELKNNDYFGFVELDDMACYVIADGITQMKDAQSAKEAIESVINAFEDEPSLSKNAMKRYLKRANKELLDRKSYEKLKASVTVVVTNYEKVRYGHAGNTRLRIYREGHRLHSSEDMSLSQDMVKTDKLPADKLSEHEERNNLYAYLGQEGFRPFVSKKIRLSNSDIIILYTRGIWENVDEGELDDVFGEAGNEPMEECDKIEDLLLSRQPEKLDNYTFAAIYIDKVFTDPKRRKKIKKIITITIIILILALVVSLVAYLVKRKRQQRIDDMNQYYANTLEYIEDNNFVRAGEQCNKALELAEKLRDKEMRERLTNYNMALEALNLAEDTYGEGDYEEALAAYVSADNRVRYADNMAEDYIESRISKLEAYQKVFDNITLGDRLKELGSFEMAEQKYLEAKQNAASIYFSDGKADAMQALDKLYEEWEEAQAEEKEAQSEKAAAELAASEMTAKGDTAMAEGDYDGAMVFYLAALEKQTKLENTQGISSLNKKIIALNDKQEEIESRVEDAKFFEEQARLFMEEKNYAEAKIQYQYAIGIYQEIGKDNKVNEIQGMIDIMDGKDEQAAAQAEKEEREKAGESGSVSGNGV